MRQPPTRRASRISYLVVLLTAVVFLKAGASEAAPRLAFETSQGRFVVELDSQGVPRATENFLGLAERGSYDGTLIHRVIKGFLIQGGDPSGDGYGGQSLWGVPFDREIDPVAGFGTSGVLAMAHRADDQRNASQFFITLAPAPWLDGRYTILGRIVDGMDVIQAIGVVAVKGPTQRPMVDILVSRVHRIDAP